MNGWDAHDGARVRAALAACAAAYVVLVAGVIAAGVLAGTPGTVPQQLAVLAREPMNGRLTFVFASLLPLFVVPVTAGPGLFVRPRPVSSVTGTLGALLVAGYAPLSAFAYASQYTLLPALIRAGRLAEAEAWHFGSPFSIAQTMDLVAYALWGAGALVIAIGLLRAPRPLAIGAWFLALSGATSVAVLVPLAWGSPAAGVLSLVSGVLSVAWAVCVIAWARVPQAGSPEARDLDRRAGM